MTDIYQAIWNADQAHAGLEPLLASETGDPARGFVRVNADLDATGDPHLRVLSEVSLPPARSGSYELCRRLFNNYALPEQAREVDTPEERTERHDFIEAILDTPPMEVARAYVAERTGEPVSRERWHNTLIEMWFREFSDGGDPALSGFEHVVVGEQEGAKVQGYHFWYKYFLDDGFGRQVDDADLLLPGLRDDRIVYVGNRAGPGQNAFPESVTIQFRWDAPDYDAMAVRPLHKKIGGFFVGCSVEGLMALGTVRAHVGAQAPKSAVIEGARYDLKVYRSPDNRHIRTFYPVFKGAADPVSGRDRPDAPPALPGGPAVAGAAGDVRILAALVNPAGDDVGRETVTIINVGPQPVDVAGWRLVDGNGRADALASQVLAPGTPATIALTGAGVQLSNKGTALRLERGDGTPAHTVGYSKAQARRPNGTVLFA